MIAAKAFPADFLSSVSAAAAAENEPPLQRPSGETSSQKSFAHVIDQTMGEEPPLEGPASRPPPNSKEDKDKRQKNDQEKISDAIAAQAAQTGLPAPVVSGPLPRQQAPPSQETSSPEASTAPPQGINPAVAGVVGSVEDQGTIKSGALAVLRACDVVAAASPILTSEVAGAAQPQSSTPVEGKPSDPSPEAAPALAGMPAPVVSAPLPQQQLAGFGVDSGRTPVMSAPLPQQQLTSTNGTSSTDTGMILPQATNAIVSGATFSGGQPEAKRPVVPAVTRACDIPEGNDSAHASVTERVVPPGRSARAEGKAPDPSPEAATAIDLPADVPPAITGGQSVPAASPELASALPAPPSGTGSAKQVTGMKTQEKTEKSSPNAAKVLPLGNIVPDTNARDTVEATPRVAGVSDRPAGNGETNPDASPLTGMADVTRLKSLPIESLMPPEPVRAHQIEKVFNDITDQVVSFKRIGAESVEVNLQPDRGTEITLHLSLNNGQVEVAARLQRGDVNSLDAHWSDLQQSLAQQGVRLGQLEHTAFGQHPGQNPHQTASSQTAQQEAGGQPQRQFERAPENLDELSVVGALAGPSRGRADLTVSSTRQTWEMWA